MAHATSESGRSSRQRAEPPFEPCPVEDVKARAVGAAARSAPHATTPGDSTGTNLALERGLSLLSALAARGVPLGLVELAREVGLSKSTCHRYVATLAALGFVEQEGDTRRYSLGLRSVEIGYAAMGSLELARVAAKPLQTLADEVGYTVNMAVLDGADIVYIERRRPALAGSRIELNMQIGTRLPAYCTSMGKVMLAYREPATVRAILGRTDLVRRGPKTITAREELASALTRIAQQGYAVNDEELAPGLRSLASPVRDRTGRVVAAVNISVHLGAWNASMSTVVGRLGEPLRRAANEISHRLGYQDLSLPGVALKPCRHTPGTAGRAPEWNLAAPCGTLVCQRCGHTCRRAELE